MKRLALAASLAMLTVCVRVAVAAPPGRTAPAAELHAHAVLAVVEPSVNVYHHEFAAPDRTGNPADWLPGYPRSSQPLKLHLGERDLAKAVQADDKLWRSLRPGQLYYIPGTRISGVVYFPSPLDNGVSTSFDSNHPEKTLDPARPVVDYTFHGTGVTSVAAGTRYGTCPDCDIVIVASEDLQAGLAWAARQPWIDVVSNSWGGPGGLPTRTTPGHPQRAADTAPPPGSVAAATAGKVVVFGSGNGVSDLGPTTHGTQHSLTWDSPFAGPPWVLTVGAAKPVTGQPTDWHNIPVDVIAQGEQRPAADYLSRTGQMQFYGTSCSAPVAAGVIAEALLRARRAVGDVHVGARHGALLSTPRALAGPAEDRRVTYLELLATAKAVAAWLAFDPATLTQDPFLTPTTSAAYAYEGYGRLDRDSIAPMTKVLLGQMPAPARPEMTQWRALSDDVRSGIWGPAPNPE